MLHDPSRPEIPYSLRRTMAEIGPSWGKSAPLAVHIKQMIDAFTALHAAATDRLEAAELDVAYGDDTRQRLDVFYPKRPGIDRPLVIFAHGGAFIEGQRDKTPEIYANVSRFFARHDIVGVNMGYRLAPDHTYPSASHDVGSVVTWAQENAERLGAAKNRIFLMAHSAGCAHAASFAYDPRLHPTAGPGIAGLILVSGRVRADNLPENPNARRVEAYYGTEPTLLEDASPVSHVSLASPPTLIAIAEFENPLIDLHSLELAHKLARLRRRAPPFVWLRDHNHTSIISHINTAENVLGEELLRFVANPT